MIKVEDIEKIRRAYFREGLSIREIGRTLHHSRRVIRRAIESADPGQYRRVQVRPTPVLGPWKEQDRCAVGREPADAAQAALHRP